MNPYLPNNKEQLSVASSLDTLIWDESAENAASVVSAVTGHINNLSNSGYALPVVALWRAVFALARHPNVSDVDLEPMLYFAMAASDGGHGDYELAILTLKSLATTLDENSKKDQQLLALTYSRIGSFYKNLQIHEEQLSYQQSAYKLLDKIVQPNSDSELRLHRALVANNLGLALFDAGNLNEAHEMFDAAFQERNELLCSSHPDLVATLSNIAHLKANEGALDAAEALYLECLSRLNESDSPICPEQVTSLDNLSVIACRRGHFETALKFSEQAVNSTFYKSEGVAKQMISVDLNYRLLSMLAGTNGSDEKDALVDMMEGLSGLSYPRPWRDDCP